MSNTPKLSDLQRAKQEIHGYAPCAPELHRAVEFQRQEFGCYECEFVIRPSDKALVVHLKWLPYLLRNEVFFRYACNFWRDRIGAFKRFEGYYTDKLDKANEFYSLDMVFVEYYPAIVGDIEFMKRQVFKIASELNDALVSELQGHVVRGAVQ